MELELEVAQNSVLSFYDDECRLEELKIGKVKSASIDSSDNQTLLIYFPRKRNIYGLNNLVARIRTSEIPVNPVCTDESEKGYLITLYPKKVYTTTII